MARSKIRLEFKRDAFRELRTSPAVVADVTARAEAVAAAAGDGFEVLPVPSPRNRARALVGTTSYEAMKKNAEENTLLRSLDAGR